MAEIESIPSDFSVKETIDRMVKVVESSGWIVFSRINHSKFATQVGLELRPTELIIFGNPKVGTFLIQDSQTTGIDLPAKALAYEDEFGKVWLTFKTMTDLKKRHNLSESSDQTLTTIRNGIKKTCQAAANK